MMIVSYFINEYEFKTVSSAICRSKPVNFNGQIPNAPSSKFKEKKS